MQVPCPEVRERISEIMRGVNPRPRHLKFHKKGERVMAKDIFDDIKQDVKKYASNVAKYAAIETREELAKTAYDAIGKFYEDYEPDFYIRHYYNFSYKSYKKYYKNNHDSVFTGGIILSPDYMDDIYRGSTELVFELVMEKGYHGLNAWNQNDYRPSLPYAITTPTPMEIIEKRQRQIASAPKQILNKAIKRADAESYNVL